ncbi:MAG: hypothetical protein A2Z34_09955 [Planctomycetes bacterium RBG_16_59_8]|nr:MAG: hypothetical protein A2Z34_09955 [Planctomycetes bacterium RBG_16_59_8]
MFSPDLTTLVVTTGSVAFIHTIAGPDHYLPFVFMARAGGWSRLKTIWITLLCGCGHIASSVFIGVVGIALGSAVGDVIETESVRGEIAAWGLILFGLLYMLWGIRAAIRNRPHSHAHCHEEGAHDHDHVHQRDHLHVHTSWVLFTIFAFGPCEPLVPLVMSPALGGNVWDAVLLVGVFGVVTIGSMLAIVLIALRGVALLPLARLERYAHAVAGAALCLCGCSIRFLGL